MQGPSHVFVLCLLIAGSILSTSTQKTITEAKLRRHDVHHKRSDESKNCANIIKSNERSLNRKPKLIFLMNITSTGDTQPSYNTFLKNSDNLFFIESSGRNHLTPREACSIESAVKNSGISGRIIIAMTSPSIDVLANNATCQIYKKFAERAVFFRHVDIETVFRGTPLHELHVKGHFKHEKKENTIFQYRYDQHM